MNQISELLVLACIALTTNAACAAVAVHMRYVANTAPPVVQYCAYLAWVLSGSLTVVLAVLAARIGVVGR